MYFLANHGSKKKIYSKAKAIWRTPRGESITMVTLGVVMSSNQRALDVGQPNISPWILNFYKEITCHWKSLVRGVVQVKAWTLIDMHMITTFLTFGFKMASYWLPGTSVIILTRSHLWSKTHLEGEDVVTAADSIINPWLGVESSGTVSGVLLRSHVVVGEGLL